MGNREILFSLDFIKNRDKNAVFYSKLFFYMHISPNDYYSNIIPT